MQQNYWLFDLDNTLHHADHGIFEIINQHMTAYLAEKLRLNTHDASTLRQHYWQKYGATLAGLQQHHPEIDLTEFLKNSHPLDKILPFLSPTQHTRELLTKISGKKFVFSNGPLFYVKAIIKNMKLQSYFHNLYGIDQLNYHYKPDPQAYLQLCHSINALPQQCIMIDDNLTNLHTAHQLGMRTIWIGQHTHSASCVDLHVSDMHNLLQHISTFTDYSVRQSVNSLQLS